MLELDGITPLTETLPTVLIFGLILRMMNRSHNLFGKALQQLDKQLELDVHYSYEHNDNQTRWPLICKLPLVSFYFNCRHLLNMIFH
jgi:hypothetical protein